MKDFTRWLRKYHFWVLLIVVIVLSAAGWYLTRTAVARQYKNNASKIDGAFRNMTTLAREELHPNQKYLEGGDELNEKRRDSVWKAWNLKYEKQGPLFAWPEPSPEIPLEKAFLDTVADLRPVETKVPWSPDQDTEELLRYKLREDYPLYIKAEIPKLAAIIGAEWKIQDADDAGGVGGGFGAPPPADGEGRKTEKVDFSKVRWDVQNQRQIVADHFDWSQRRDPVPTTLEILYAQEDLWVYRALMKIIRETNGGTGSGAPLAIPQIDFIRIGKRAKWNPAPITGHGIKAAGTGRATAEDEEGAEQMPAPVHGEGGRESRGAADAPTGDPADFRYVDMENQPLTGEKLRGTTGGAGTEQATLAVAKRIPVHMKLVIDQREINKLLVECGNSPLMVEVQQLRFNPGAGVTGFGPARPGGAAAGMALAAPDYRPVELFGIISMYNPVNASALGKEVAAEEEGEEEGAEDGTEEGTEDTTEETTDPGTDDGTEETTEEGTADDAADAADTAAEATDAAADASDTATEPAGAATTP